MKDHKKYLDFVIDHLDIVTARDIIRRLIDEYNPDIYRMFVKDKEFKGEKKKLDLLIEKEKCE